MMHTGLHHAQCDSLPGCAYFFARTAQLLMGESPTHSGKPNLKKLAELGQNCFRFSDSLHGFWMQSDRILY
jgi:hypothetical protein